MPEVTDPVSASSRATPGGSPSANGSAIVGHRPIGNDGPGKSVQAKLDYLGTFGPEHRYSNEASDTLAFKRALLALGASTSLRTQPDGAPNYGFGVVTIPKGIMHSDSGFSYGSGLLGLNVVGANQFSSALTASGNNANGIALGPYVGVHLEGLYIRNKSGAPAVNDTSAGILLDSTGGGALLTLDRLVISQFHTAIKQKASNITDGDKTLVTSCALGAALSMIRA